MSLQLSSDKDYVGLLNDQTDKYEWIPKKVAEKYLGDKQEEINQDKKDKEARRDWFLLDWWWWFCNDCSWEKIIRSNKGFILGEMYPSIMNTKK